MTKWVAPENGTQHVPVGKQNCQVWSDDIRNVIPDSRKRLGNSLLFFFFFSILINLTKIFLKGKAEYIELQKYATNFQTKFSTSWDGGDSLLILPLSLAKNRLSWRLYGGFIRCLIVLFSASSFRWIIMQSPFLSPSSTVFSIFPFGLLVSGQRLSCLGWFLLCLAHICQLSNFLVILFSGLLQTNVGSRESMRTITNNVFMSFLLL